MRKFLLMVAVLAVLAACGRDEEIQFDELYFNVIGLIPTSPRTLQDNEILLQRNLTNSEIRSIFANFSNDFRGGEVFFGLDGEVLRIRAYDEHGLVVTIGGNFYMLGAWFPVDRTEAHGMMVTSYIVEGSRIFTWNPSIRWSGDHTLAAHFILGERFEDGDFIRIEGTSHFVSMVTYEPDVAKGHITDIVNKLILFPVDLTKITLE